MISAVLHDGHADYDCYLPLLLSTPSRDHNNASKNPPEIIPAIQAGARTRAGTTAKAGARTRAGARSGARTICSRSRSKSQRQEQEQEQEQDHLNVTVATTKKTMITSVCWGGRV